MDRGSAGRKVRWVNWSDAGGIGAAMLFGGTVLCGGMALSGGSAAGQQPAPLPAAGKGQGSVADTPAATLGYALGLRIGSRIAADFKAQGTTVDPTSLARGLADAILGAPPLVSEEALSKSLDAFDARMQEKEKAFLEQLAATARNNKSAAMTFLTSNARKRGIQTLPSGLQYEIVKAAEGPRPRPEQAVTIRVVGRHLDGKEFGKAGADSEPATCRISEEIRGWQEALVLMPVGSKWRLFVPPELAYGDRGWPPEVGPNELLIFDIELLGISSQP